MLDQSSCLSEAFYCCDKTTMTKSILERKGLFPLALSVAEGRQGRNLEARIEAGAMEEHCLWLASHGLLSLFSYTPQDHLTRGDIAHSGLVLPMSISNRKKGTQTHLIEAFFQLRLCTLK